LVSFQTREGWGGLRSTGLESAEFLLAANPGLPPRSLARTASGGELSRVLLALKSALSEAGGAETLVFDEIDAGIGGRTAAAVGRKVSELSTSSQVVVVTHLAQVAALADRHYVVEKVGGEGPTITRLRLVEEEAVVEELCRMMGGQPEDAEAMAHARQLRHRSRRPD
jgi:DNA repair protein RecN (Recombination protein N)